MPKRDKRGTNDSPVMRYDDDKFGVHSYVDSLCDFVKDCETPMTVAIQGDWGSGKTSMMNMMKEKLGDEVISIWFNTWQFSQFNQDDELALSFLGSLIEAFDIDNQETKEVRVLSNTIRWAKYLTIAATEKLIGEKTAERVEEGLKLQVNNEVLDMAKTISKLKEQFQAALNANLQIKKKDRIVVFVDDLDRLQPAKAVELLEILKVFLDCDNCVYVLAIDYEVVSQGIKQKFGDTIGEAKGRNFFDKIIQLPFKMPVGHYKIDNYLQGLLKAIWGDVEENEEQDIEKYIEMIDKTIGKNPRSIKRTINAFELISKVAEKKNAFGSEKEVRKDKQKLLFALLCIQLSYEELYNYLLHNINEINDEFFESLSNDDSFKGILKKVFKLDTIEQDFFEELDGVIEIFCEWCDNLKNSKAPGNAYHAVIEILSFSSITAQSPSTKRNPVSYGTFEELADLVQCTESVKNLYINLEKLILETFKDEKIDIKATLGQKCMIFYIQVDNKNKRFMEVKINKTTLTLYLLLDTKSVSQSEIEQQTNTNVRIIKNKAIAVNRVVTAEIVQNCMPYIHRAVSHIKGVGQQ